MKVCCPQCGREFNVPDSEVHRVLQCMCKHLFKAKDAAVTAESKASVPTLSANQGFYLEDEETSAAPESKLSTEELDGFLNKLKKSRETLSGDDQKSREAAPVKIHEPQTIELGESRAQKPKVPPAPDVSFVSEPSVESIDISSPSATRAPVETQNKPNPSQISTPRHPRPTPPSNLWERFQDLSWPKQIAILAGIAVPVTVGVITINHEDVKQEAMDPRIQQLLSPTATSSRPKGSPATPTPREPQAVERKTPATKPEKISVAPTPQETAKPVSTSLQAMLRDTYRGDFENVVRRGARQINKLSDEELALYFEALLARAGRNVERIQQIRAEIESSRPRASMPPAILRAQLVALLRDPKAASNLRRVIETFESLSLTRSHDPLVFAYWGMAYEKLERTDLAHQVWDQALTLEPQLAWLIERRLQLYEAKDDSKNARVMAAQLSQIQGYEFAGYSKLGHLDERAGRKDAAEKNYRLALKYQESSALRLALADRFAPNPHEGIRELQLALDKAQDPKIKSAILMRLGKLHCDLDNVEAGLKYLRTALKEIPTSSESYFQKGLCERRVKLEAKASESFEAALKFGQNDHRLWYYYGLSLSGQGKTKAAVAALTRSLQIKPTEAAHIQMAETLRQQNKKQEALTHARKALQLNPDSRRARTLVADLQNLTDSPKP